MDDIHIAIESGNMGFSLIYRYNFIGIDITFGYLALQFIAASPSEEEYWISSHQKPYSNVGSLWQSFDKEIWGCFVFSILVLAVLMISLNSISNGNIEVTDIMIRIALGFLEPYVINWHKTVKSIRFLIISWLFLGKGVSKAVT